MKPTPDAWSVIRKACAEAQVLQMTYGLGYRTFEENSAMLDALASKAADAVSVSLDQQGAGSTGGAPTRDELAKIVGEAWASADTETLDDDLLAASTEVRAAVREALATLAAEMFEHDSWGSSTVIEFRDREYSALSSESPDTEQKP